MHKVNIKKQIGQKAATLVEDGMIIGLGTGTTAACFIESLAKLQKKIIAIATSRATEELARSLHIPLRSIDEVEKIDITFDGADEIDTQKRLLKGAGGALLREKIIASASDELIIMVEEKKCVSLLGAAKVAIEILPFGHKHTIAHLSELGYRGTLRLKANEPTITDNHNYIFDIQFPAPTAEPERHDKEIRSVPGVIETGFFFGLTGRVVIGSENGSITIC